MNRDQKAALVEELAEQMRSADAIFAVDYRGISVSEVADLRAKLRDADTRFRIVKNSLTERASDAAGVEALKSLLEGPTALAFVAGDAALAAKALNDTARALDTLQFKGGLLDGATLSADELKSLARLPAREVLHAQLVGTIAAPLSGLVRTLNALISGLAVQLGQIAEQGLVSGEAPAADASPSEATTPSETDGEAAAPDAIASDADTSSAAEPEADAEPAAEPEAAAEPAADAEPAAEPEAAAEPAADSEDTAAEPQAEKETDASVGEAEASKED
ncbi:MAG TPA: 50S ribosomal protein L10 [Solirubrobacteraceae bacterium]|nr:50S ribosomal protein L10 [Solirubrobacteraceae bacterium]